MSEPSARQVHNDADHGLEGRMIQITIRFLGDHGVCVRMNENSGNMYEMRPINKWKIPL
jgi:hypothetical protein